MCVVCDMCVCDHGGPSDLATLDCGFVSKSAPLELCAPTITATSVLAGMYVLIHTSSLQLCGWDVLYAFGSDPPQSLA